MLETAQRFDENDRLQQEIEAVCREPGTVVIDHALGDGWEIPGGRHSTPLENVKIRTKALSLLQLGGLKWWRVPTLEEAFSLMHLAHCGEYRDGFTQQEKRIWVADTFGVQRLSVNLSTGKFRLRGLSLSKPAYGPSSRVHYQRVVRGNKGKDSECESKLDSVIKGSGVWTGIPPKRGAPMER
jgi:hypothetical protein